MLQPINFIFLISCLVFTAYIITGLHRLGRKKPLQSRATVRISVIIPFRNEAGNLPQLLDCLRAQDYDRGLYEVIFVDDHSTDGGAEYLVKTAATGGLKIKLERLKEGVFSKKRAIEAGIDLAEGELMITSDADVRMTNTWLSEISTAYAGDKPDMILGSVAVSDAFTMTGRFEKMDTMALQVVTAAFAANGNAILCNGANLAYPKKHFTKLGGYSGMADTPSGDDFFLLMKFRAEGLNRVTYLPGRAASVYLKSASDLRAFINQRARWASKTRFSGSTSVLLPAAWLFFTSLWMVLLPLYELASAVFPWSSILLYTVKCAGDFLILRTWTSVSGQAFTPFEFIFSFALYPFYICFIVVYSLFFSTEWKGRKLQPAL